MQVLGQAHSHLVPLVERKSFTKYNSRQDLSTLTAILVASAMETTRKCASYPSNRR